MADLELLIASFARYVSVHRVLPLPAAERIARQVIAAAMTEYRRIGAPYGESSQGLVRWMMEHPERPPVA
jgi:hypothetical protein